MTGQAARALGYGFAVYEPQAKSPAGPSVADLEINAPYSDEAALKSLADAAIAGHYEFENVPVEATRVLEEKVTLFIRVLKFCTFARTVKREKNFFEGQRNSPRPIRYRRFP